MSVDSSHFPNVRCLINTRTIMDLENVFSLSPVPFFQLEITWSDTVWLTGKIYTFPGMYVSFPNRLDWISCDYLGQSEFRDVFFKKGTTTTSFKSLGTTPCKQQLLLSPAKSWSTRIELKCDRLHSFKQLVHFIKFHQLKVIRATKTRLCFNCFQGLIWINCGI